mmetsp:Transcript_40297/g.64600  ORF Transcript_40297/g.64600 Transcript_40297/m.64600 type:complete len:288 (+) Transcript_40297:15-878(+)
MAASRGWDEGENVNTAGDSLLHTISSRRSFTTRLHSSRTSLPLRPSRGHTKPKGSSGTNKSRRCEHADPRPRSVQPREAEGARGGRPSAGQRRRVQLGCELHCAAHIPVLPSLRQRGRRAEGAPHGSDARAQHGLRRVPAHAVREPAERRPDPRAVRAGQVPRGVQLRRVLGGRRQAGQRGVWSGQGFRRVHARLHRRHAGSGEPRPGVHGSAAGGLGPKGRRRGGGVRDGGQEPGVDVGARRCGAGGGGEGRGGSPRCGQGLRSAGLPHPWARVHCQAYHRAPVNK